MRLTKDDRHLNWIDGLRFIAAILVVLFHATLFDWPRTPHDPHPWYTSGLWPILFGGHFMVSLFIVISGYCLMRPVLKAGCRLNKGVLNFYRRRAIRILPAYFAALALSLLVYCLANHLTILTLMAQHGKSVLIQVCLMQDWFLPVDMENFNGTLWTVAVEIKIYVLFPMIVICWRKFGAVATLACLAILAYAFHWVALQLPHQQACPQYLLLFGFGAAAVAITETKVAASASGFPRHAYSLPLSWRLNI